MDQNTNDMSRRALLTSAIGSAAGLTAVAVAGSPAAAASGSQHGGVAWVVDPTAGEDLVVRLRANGTKLRVPARGFGEMQVARGDIVAVMPDFAAASDSLVAHPYLRVDPSTRAVLGFDRKGDVKLIGTHA